MYYNCRIIAQVCVDTRAPQKCVLSKKAISYVPNIMTDIESRNLCYFMFFVAFLKTTPDLKASSTRQNIHRTRIYYIIIKIGNLFYTKYVKIGFN